MKIKPGIHDLSGISISETKTEKIGVNDLFERWNLLSLWLSWITSV